MRVGIDIDDVLFDWYGRAHAACERAGITNGITPRTWAPGDEYGCGLDPWLEALAAATLDGSLYSGDPIPGATDALARLRDAGHTVHLVTARGFLQWGDLIRQQTVQWISDHEIPHDTLTFAKDKTLIRTDVFADDAEHNVAMLAAAGVRVCLIDAPHNQHVAHDWRAQHVADFVERLLGE